MPISDKTLPLEFPFPSIVKAVACCDLDETYIPFSPENKSAGGVHELEKFLTAEGQNKGILLGWVTGSNLSSALRKTQGYIASSPHFLCSGLGTEFYWIKNGKLFPSISWAERIKNSGFNVQNVEKVLHAIDKKGIVLEKQPDDYQGPYRTSFYYRIRENMQQDFAWIENTATSYRVRTLLLNATRRPAIRRIVMMWSSFPTAAAKTRRSCFFGRKWTFRSTRCSPLAIAAMTSPCLSAPVMRIWSQTPTERP